MSAVASADCPSGGRERVGELSSGELALVLEAAEAVSGSLDFQQVLGRIARAARALLGTDMSTVLILDQDRQLLNVAAFDGLDPNVARRLSTPVGKNLAGLAAELGQCVRSSDIECDDRSALGEVCAGHIRSTIIAPIMREGRVLGVLGAETRARRNFTARDEQLLCLLAKHGAIAIETASLYAAELQRVDALNNVLTQLNRQNDAMRRSREAHDRLTEAALEGVGHGSLLHVLVDLVPAPIALTNQFGCRLGAASPPEDQRLEALWCQCRDSPAFKRQLEHLRANAALAVPASGTEEGFWRTVVVAAGGEVLGALVVLDRMNLEELHMVVLEQAASVVATELLRERGIAEAEARAGGDLVRMLVSREGWGEDAQERAARLGHDLTDGQCVVAISGESPGSLPDSRSLTSATRRAAARAGLRGLVGESDGVTAALLVAGDRALCRDAVDAWITDFRKEVQSWGCDQLRFGLSAIPSEPRQIRQAFECARQALAVCRLGDTRQVTYFEDVQLIATLIDISKPESVKRYIERTIGKLCDYDQRKRTDLAHTLETYLDCSGVARHAAKALYLHPHSLRYRLRRICEVQDLDLGDPMTRLTTHLALKLRRMLAEPS